MSLDAEDDARLFWDKSGVSFPVLFGDRRAADAYGLVCTPSHFLVGPDGRIVTSWDAFDRTAWNAMAEMLEGMIGRPVKRLTAEEAPDFRAGCTLH